MTQLWSIALVLTASLVGSFGPILIKKGTANLTRADGIPNMIKRTMTNYHLIGGIGLYGLSTILFIPALRGGDLSILYPLVAIGYVFVTLWAVLILKEKMNSSKWIGLSLIIAGVICVGLA